jgi:Na+/melibiose symporter-like transporter
MQRLSVPSKIGYGAGGMSFSIKDVAFVNFVLFYYTQVVGLSGMQTGFVLMLTLMWDAVSDPIIGSFSDNFRSRWGRRHPFMAVGGIPFALTFLALFHPPMHWSPAGKFWWMLATCILLRTFLTTFIIPHTSLAPELSREYQERSSIIGVRTVMGWLNYMALYFVTLRFFLKPVQDADGQWIDGRLIADSYGGYAILSCILVVLYTTISTVSTWRFIPQLRTATGDAARFSLVQILRDFAWAMRNHNFRIMCIMMLTGAAAVGVGVTLYLIVGTYFWEFTTNQLAYAAPIQAAGAVIAFLLLKPLGRRFDKHRLITVCLLMFIFTTGLVVCGRLLDLLPENGHPLVYIVYLANLFVAAIFTLLYQVMTSSYTADIVDEQEYDLGRRQEGVFYATEAFAYKSMTGIGNMFGGFILDFVSFPNGAAPGTVPEDVLFRLGVIVGPVLGCTFLVPLGLSLLLRLTRERHAEIKEALIQRHAEASE